MDKLMFTSYFQAEGKNEILNFNLLKKKKTKLTNIPAKQILFKVTRTLVFSNNSIVLLCDWKSIFQLILWKNHLKFLKLL